MAAGRPPDFARSANGLLGRYRPDRPDHQVVTVDHLRPAADAEDVGHVPRGAALDLLGVLGVVGDEAAADLVGVGAAHDDGVAAGERTVYPDHTGRQQAFSR